jgi:hypothetical protein
VLEGSVRKAGTRVRITGAGEQGQGTAWGARTSARLSTTKRRARAEPRRTPGLQLWRGSGPRLPSRKSENWPWRLVPDRLFLLLNKPRLKKRPPLLN